jgi:hypothetical protein
MSDITYIGVTDFRNQHQKFGIKDQDRFGHIYAIGKTGTGKSTLLLAMAISDMQRGNGCCVIDPHGDVSLQLLQYVSETRINDVAYFNAGDNNFPIGFNPLYNVHVSNHNLVVSALVNTFKKIWFESWGPRLEHILRFCLHTLLYYPKATLLDIQPLLTDAYFRNGVLNYIPDLVIRNFWKKEFDSYPPALRSEAIAPILNKTGLFLASLPLRYIIGQEKSTFQLQEIMDKKKILICNLSKGMIGEDASSLLGSMILTAIQSAALQRASYKPEDRIPFYVYVDEMHSFVTLSFADILAESRKYKLGLFLTHQYIEQLSEKIRSAIFGNVGTLISFRIGAEDAQYVEKEFAPVFSPDDLVNLPRYAMYLKLMIDGATSRPFSAITIPLPSTTVDCHERIITLSRHRYAKEIINIEHELYQKYKGSSPQYTEGSLFG